MRTSRSSPEPRRCNCAVQASQIKPLAIAM